MTEDQQDLFNPMPHFNGADYVPKFDYTRLGKQLRTIYDVVKSGQWYTLSELARITEYPEASISAQLRHLRKERFGSHEVERRPRGDRKSGLYEYRVTND